MKKAIKSILSISLIGLLIISLSGCAKIGYVANGVSTAIGEIKSGEWKNVDTVETDTNDDPVVIDEFVPGTYGGIEFTSIEDVAKYYADAYNKTKAKTAMFIDEEGNKVEMFALEGTKEIIVSDLLVDGKENSVINNLIPQLLDSLYKPTVGGLQPCNEREPAKDVDENGDSLLTTRTTAEDLIAANVTDNGDGTITLMMQPKRVEMSRVGLDAQGNMFTSLNDIASVVDAVSIFSWASGSTDENVKVSYHGGTAEITIDTASGEVVKAKYDMKAYVSIVHANIAVVHDKSMSATVDFICEYPATDEFYDKVNVHPAE